MGLLRLVALRAAGYLNDEIQTALWPVAPYLRQLGVGLILVIVSALAWLSTLAFGLLGFFFYLSELDNFVAPALWTGGISLSIGLLLLLFGMSLIRRPNRY